MQGRVVWFNSGKGFGFLRCDGTNKEIFVHHTAIQMSGYRRLEADQKVEFEVIEGSKGPQADKVTVIEG